MLKFISAYIFLLLFIGCKGDNEEFEQNPDASKIDSGLYDSRKEKDTSTEDTNIDYSGYNPVEYHGGPVMDEPVNIYIIWYGNWPAENKNLIKEFLDNFGKSEYNKINTRYWAYKEPLVTLDASPETNNYSYPEDVVDAPNNISKLVYTTSEIKVAQEIDNNFSLGKSLTKEQIEFLVIDNISKKLFPLDKNGIYLVLGDKDIIQTIFYYEFCNHFCGWHWYTTIEGSSIKYSYIGDATRCPDNCGIQDKSPNNNPSIDAMLSVVAHEVEEVMTDPEISAWYTVRGDEGADVCAWKFGKVYSAPNGSAANMKIGEKHYRIQMEWILEPESQTYSKGYCGLSLNK